MIPLHPNTSLLAVASRREDFVTLDASDLDGPRTRQRVVSQRACLAEWLKGYAVHLRVGQTLVAVGVGRAGLGSTTRIRSIVTFTPANGCPPVACIYVEELVNRARSERSAAPVHIVRCPELPKAVRFVELAPGKRADPALRVI